LPLWIFSVFLLIFLFASLNFDHPQKKKNQSRVVLNPSFLLVCVYILFIANPNRRWTATSPTKRKHILCGWSRKILHAKVMCNTRSKSGGRRAL
jgi:cytochrome c biogenesis factor